MKKYLIVVFLLLFYTALYGQEKKDTTLKTIVQFIVNTDEIIEDSGYSFLLDTLVPYIKENQEYLEKVYIRSSSSLEGTKKRNQYLSDLRASKVLSLMPVISHSVLTILSAGEDWEGLYQAVYNSNVPERDKILKDLSNRKKPGREVLSEFLPAFRSCSIEARFSFPKPCKKDTIVVRDTMEVHDTLYISKPVKKYPIVGVKTNLLLDAFPYSPFGLSFTPNVQIEIYTWLWGLSLEFEYTFPWWRDDSKYKYYQIINGCVGIRKYFNNKYNKWYLGIYGNTGYYDLCINESKGWQGEEFGGGISFGYVLQKGRWKFEPYLRLGYLYSRFDTYHAGDPFEGKYYYDWIKRVKEFVPRRFDMNYFGPTMIGFCITYDLIEIKRQ